VIPLRWVTRPASGLALLLIVLAVALAIGSGITDSSPATAKQIAVSIDSTIRCPSCEDLSVAESTASSALAVRRDVTRLVRSGQSAGQIDSTLVSQYGPTILLRPPASGLSLLVWLLPLAGAVAAVGTLGALFVRRSRALARLRTEPREGAAP
jgi:cytochrome c-type biogenesis protein CcmH